MHIDTLTFRLSMNMKRKFEQGFTADCLFDFLRDEQLWMEVDFFVTLLKNVCENIEHWQINQGWPSSYLEFEAQLESNFVLIEADEIYEIVNMIEDAIELIQFLPASFEYYDSPAPFPFPGHSWVNLALKRLVQEAVANNKQWIGFADAGVVADRWGKDFNFQYDLLMPKLISKIAGVKPEHIFHQVEGEGSRVAYWKVPITNELKKHVNNEGFALF